MIDPKQFFECMTEDKELLYKMREMNASISLNIADTPLRVEFEDGAPASCTWSDEQADITIRAEPVFWEGALQKIPKPSFESLNMAQVYGGSMEGDFERLISPYMPGLERMIKLMRLMKYGSAHAELPSEPWKDTDNTVGRYCYVNNGELEARIYYETAGNGKVPLVLQHTAGADSRQYRHLLANPEMQQKYTMYAWDLPYHGRSNPPIDHRWWEEKYLPTKEDLMNWTVAIVETLKIDRPIFLGASLGGQLAFDLAAHHGDKFRGFVPINGSYELVSSGLGVMNELYRRPTTSREFPMSSMLSLTAPTAPEAAAHEVYWVYSANFPSVYPGDNDYYFNGHDMREDGHLIDTEKTPVYSLTGEYEQSCHIIQNDGSMIKDKIPGTMHKVMPGLSHFAPAEDPINFCKFIIPVLDELVVKCK